jgi:hypothetical protein
MDLLTLITLIGISVAGLATILAIWMERDPRRPAKFAWALSVLILMATGVMILQSVLDARDQAVKEAKYVADQEKLEGDLARMLQKLDTLASESDDPEVVALLSAELEAQARTNPNVVQKLAQRFADEGEDPSEKLGKHMKSSEVEKLKKKGSLKVDENKKKKKKNRKDRDREDEEREKRKKQRERDRDRDGDKVKGEGEADGEAEVDQEDGEEGEGKKGKKGKKDKKDKKDGKGKKDKKDKKDKKAGLSMGF